VGRANTADADDTARDHGCAVAPDVRVAIHAIRDQPVPPVAARKNLSDARR
jgi:hypothetical protein